MINSSSSGMCQRTNASTPSTTTMSKLIISLPTEILLTSLCCSIVNQVLIHPDGGCLSSASADKSIKIWDIKSHQLIQHYPAHSDAVTSIALHDVRPLYCSSSTLILLRPSLVSTCSLPRRTRRSRSGTCAKDASCSLCRAIRVRVLQLLLTLQLVLYMSRCRTCASGFFLQGW